MIKKTLHKFLIIIGLSLFINLTYVSAVYAHDHTPRKKLIFKLQTEILELGGNPVKKGNPFKADQDYIDELEDQLSLIIEEIKKKEGIEKVKNEIIDEIKKFNIKPVTEKESFIDSDAEVIALRKQLEEIKLKQEIEQTKADLIKELADLGIKIESKTEVDSDEEIIKLREQLEEVKAQKKLEQEEKKKAEEKRIAEQKKKEEARIKEVKNELLKELEKLGVKPKLDTSDVDDNAEIIALKKQIDKIKSERKKAADKKKAEEKKVADQKEADRQKAIEDVKKEILFLSETPMPEYEFNSEDKYIAALREQLEEIRKIKEEEELKMNAAIPEWFIKMPKGSETLIYARGSHSSADLDASETFASAQAREKLAQQLQTKINVKIETAVKEAGIDGDLTLKQEFSKVSKLVAKNVLLKGYKVYNTQMAPVTGGKFRTYIVLELQIGMAYKAYLENIENNDVIKKKLPKLKDTAAFKELEQYVAEFGA
ncbi:hypothetical protein OA516_01095 [Candidatus Pelagibacter sp.]|nr:hypothetical protein [Candidatus Pelagibacter sp.]